LKQDILLEAFKKAMGYEDVNRIMEGGVSIPLSESGEFESFKEGVLYAEAQNTIHNSSLMSCPNCKETGTITVKCEWCEKEIDLNYQE
jgi:hypothetical protein